MSGGFGTAAAGFRPAASALPVGGWVLILRSALENLSVVSDSPQISGSVEDCLVNIVTQEMEAEPALEAVRVNRAQGSLSVATLGIPYGKAGMASDLANRLQKATATPRGRPCALLSGAPDCVECPRVRDVPSPGRFVVHHGQDATTISRVTCPTAPTFWRWRDHPLPRFVPREVRLPEDEHAENEWKPQLLAAALCGLAGLLGWWLRPGLMGIAAFALAYLAGSWFPALEAWERLRERRLDVHFLMLAVAVGAAAIGAWTEGTALLFLFSFSGALEHYAMGRTHREIRSLIRAAPKEAVVLDDAGVEHRLSVDNLDRGMRLLVKPGELFAVDAEVSRGATAADESNLTGEAVPAEKKVGDAVFGGTLNLWGAVEVVVQRRASQSALHRIIQLIHESQRLKAPSQRFTDRFGTGYTFGILGLTTVMFFVWWLGFERAPFVASGSTQSAFYLAMSLLVVASPCALVLSIPSAILAAIAHGARRGILFRGGSAVEKLAEITVVAMDKTGTLTTGELRVESVESLPPGREAEVLRLAYAVERLSTHPLARAITRHGKRAGLTAPEVHEVTSETGLGIRAVLDGTAVVLGRRQFVLGDAPPEGLAVSTSEAGVSEVWVRHGSLIGRVLLRDDIRPQARDVVAELRAQGLYTVALTGDRRFTGEHLQRELALDEVRCELSPQAKVTALVDFAKAGRRAAMIGDGVNDAPALAVAHVGVAMGARGSDAALEQADVVLMHDRLENFQIAHDLSRRARRIIRENIGISLGTLCLLVVLALGARLPLTEGVLGHEGSTVLVVLNSLRLLFRGRATAASKKE